MAEQQQERQPAAGAAANEEAAAVALPANNYDNNHHQQQHEREILALLESIDDYNRRRNNRENHHNHDHVVDDNNNNNLLHPEEGFQDPDAYCEDTNYAAKRESEGKEYQESFFKSVFAKDDELKSFHKAGKDRYLNSLKGKTIIVMMSSGDEGSVIGDDETTKILEAPLDVVAASCDIVLQLVQSKTFYHNVKVYHEVLKSGSSANTTSEEQQFTLDLKSFPMNAVESFFSIIISNKPLASADISEDCIVDICRISHFVQCNSVFEECVDIIKASIDSKNCLSICSLADTLDIPSLFEASVTHLLDRLEYIQQNEHWIEFPTYLRNKIITMRNAVQSSILGRGQKASIFFSSSAEFLSIFSDNIREQQERLDEAKRRQHQIINERIHEQNRDRGQPILGDWSGVVGRGVIDAENKIERQTKRLKTLESFYKEQKLIFAKSNNSEENGYGCVCDDNDGKCSGGFRLGFSC